MSRHQCRVYGRSLQELFDEEGGGLPAVLKHSLRFLNSANGLTTPALFRLTGDGKKAQLIRSAWDQGKDPLRATTDAFAVAAALRLWLANLPDSVIPCALYMTLIDVERNHTGLQKTAALQLCLRKVPTVAAKVLYPLLEFLHHYRLNQRRANTPASDLASTFAPLLLRPPEGLQRGLEQKEEESRLASALTDTLISEYRTLFSHRSPIPALPPPQSLAVRSDLTCRTVEASEAQLRDGVDPEIEILVGNLVLDSTTSVLFNSDDLPFAQTMSSCFSTSSWSSLHSEFSSSGCSSPDSTFSQGPLSPSSDDSFAASLDGDEGMEWEGHSSLPSLDCSDQALAPFFEESYADPTTGVWQSGARKASPTLLSAVCLPHGPGMQTRSISVNLMSTEQIVAEKVALKSQLEVIRDWFESMSGMRSLRKRDKEALRPLFVRYHRLKRALRRRRSMQATAALGGFIEASFACKASGDEHPLAEGQCL